MSLTYVDKGMPDNRNRHITLSKRNDMPTNWQARDRKLDKRRNKDHVVDNRGIFVMKAANEKRDAKKAEAVRKMRERP